MSLVQRFDMDADTQEQLELALQILMRWTSSVSHYVSGVDAGGWPYLALLWGAPESAKDAAPLIAKMKAPQAIASQIYAWLETTEYGEQPDHDGSNKKGYRITLEVPEVPNQPTWQRPSWANYIFCVVRPTWIEYHK